MNGRSKLGQIFSLLKIFAGDLLELLCGVHYTSLFQCIYTALQRREGSSGKTKKRDREALLSEIIALLL
jgi:hypothetical protein